MRIIGFDEFKANARIDIEVTEENIQLVKICEAAEDAVLNMIDRTYEDVMEEYNNVMPAPIKQACLMLATHFYEYRGVVSPTSLYTVPYTIDVLLKPYIRL